MQQQRLNQQSEQRCLLQQSKNMMAQDELEADIDSSAPNDLQERLRDFDNESLI